MRRQPRLCQNATLAVAEEILGADGRVYLRLADGRGWAFDDSALFPHDPSVVCLWRSFSPKPQIPGLPPFPFQIQNQRRWRSQKVLLCLAKAWLLAACVCGTTWSQCCSCGSSSRQWYGRWWCYDGCGRQHGKHGKHEAHHGLRQSKFARSRSEPVDPELVCTALPKALHRACHFGTMDFIWCSRSHSAKPKPVRHFPT